MYRKQSKEKFGEASREDGRTQREPRKIQTECLADQPREQHWNEVGREGTQGQGWGHRKSKLSK